MLQYHCVYGRRFAAPAFAVERDFEDAYVEVIICCDLQI